MRKNVFIFFVTVFFGFMNLSAYAQEDIQKNKSCKYCGMDREKFSHTQDAHRI